MEDDFLKDIAEIELTTDDLREIFEEMDDISNLDEIDDSFLSSLEEEQIEIFNKMKF